ncbi:MAG: 1-acyl-sn-glycerol-3-phosphate acyltransferase [Erysipelotrichaceae bacterium]|nr:1-acyl-sn-glycerol-3-phosphate acyltransferase [Erysipelotrichaceae bacterium]
MSSVSTDYVKYEPSYKVLKALLYPVALSFRPKIYGKENIPEEGPVIICLNHRYNPDPAWACLATRRVVHFLAKKELHESKFSLFFRMAGTISVDRQAHDHKAMDAAEEMLRKGHVIGIFPEGTRNRTEDPLLPFKYGAVRMAQKTGASIVPMIAKGTFSTGVRIYIGEAYKISEDADLTAENEKLRNIMLEMYTSNE